MSMATGVSRLDELLGGGVPMRSSLLIHGPRFTGRGQLARRMLLEGLRLEQPAVLIHTERTAEEEWDNLRSIEPGLPDIGGSLARIDLATRLWGAPEDSDIHYVDGPKDLSGLAKAVNDAQKKVGPGDHILVLDSLSTVVAHSDAAAAYRFLQVLFGRARRAGATCVAVLDDTMHDAREVAMVRHLMNGAIQTRASDGKHQMRLFGLGTRSSLGWIDYQASPASFDLTGSFSAGRIR